MNKVRIEITGEFEDRDEAADALEEAASCIRLGYFSAASHADENPKVFVLEPAEA